MDRTGSSKSSNKKCTAVHHLFIGVAYLVRNSREEIHKGVVLEGFYFYNAPIHGEHPITLLLCSGAKAGNHGVDYFLEIADVATVCLWQGAVGRFLGHNIEINSNWLQNMVKILAHGKFNIRDPLVGIICWVKGFTTRQLKEQCSRQWEPDYQELAQSSGTPSL